jgi:hypothetical protein
MLLNLFLYQSNGFRLCSRNGLPKGGAFRAVLPKNFMSTSVSVKDSLAPYFANKHPINNVPDGIIDKLDRKLHLQRHHPLNIIKTK